MLTKEQRATPEKAKEVMAGVYARVQEVEDDIRRYWYDGWMPVVVVSPDPDAHEALSSLGWKGNRACFGVRRNALKPMLYYPSERRWLERPAATAQLQAFLFVHLGTLLLVRVPGYPWMIEPGTLDGELVS